MAGLAKEYVRLKRTVYREYSTTHDEDHKRFVNYILCSN